MTVIYVELAADDGGITPDAKYNTFYSAVLGTGQLSADLLDEDGVSTGISLTEGAAPFTDSGRSAGNADSSPDARVDVEFFRGHFFKGGDGEKFVLGGFAAAQAYTLEIAGQNGAGRDTIFSSTNSSPATDTYVPDSTDPKDAPPLLVFTGTADGSGNISIGADLVSFYPYCNGFILSYTPSSTPTISNVDGDDVVYPGQSFNINGSGFGATQGSGGVDVDGVAYTVNTWSDTVINVTAVLGGNEYGSHTLTVTTDTSDTDTIAITQESEAGTAAVDVVDPVTTEDSIFYQVDSGTPATGQQIWHDDSPNTVVNPDGTFEQTIVRDFNARVWDDADSTWGAITLIQANFDATPALDGVVYTDSEVSGTLTVGVVLEGTVSQLTSIDGALGVTLPMMGDIEQGTALEGELGAITSLEGTIEQLSALEASIVIAVSFNGDPLEQIAQVEGTLSLTLPFEGSLEQVGELEGALDLNILLSGSIEQQSQFEGALAGGQIELEGTLEQNQTLEGTLIVPLEFGGALEQSTELESRLVLAIAFSGLLTQADFLSGSLIKGKVLAGSLLQPTQFVGTLSTTLSLNPLPIETLGIVSGQLLSPNLNSSGWLTLSDIYMHTDLTIDSIYFEPV